MDVVEPQRPDSGGNDGIESDCRGRSGTIVNSDSGQEKDNKIYKHKRAEAKQQPNTSSRESVVVEERREQAKEIREKKKKGNCRKLNSMHFIVSQTAGIVEKTVKP